MTDEGRLVSGRYRLVSRVGAGAMGVVWRAHDERLNRTVAVKKLLLQPGLPADEAAEAVARCLREGRIAARLQHPNAISVFDVVDEDGAPCLIMEYLPSQSLADVMAEHGPLPPHEVARIGSQAADALAAAHHAGIVHRDVKPGNILLGDDGSVKITDFGISRANDDVTVTKTGMIAGTPAYLAPEVAIGREPTPAADVFSLGSTLYAAVEGQPPFGLTENTLGLLHRVAAGKINPPTMAGPLTDVLVAMLAAEPGFRPSTARTRDLLDAVSRGEHPMVDTSRTALALGPAWMATGGGLDDDPSTQMIGGRTAMVGRTGTNRPVARPHRPQRSRAPMVVAGVLLAALVATGAWMLGAKDTSDNQRTPQQGSPTSYVVPPAQTVPSAEYTPSTTVAKAPGTTRSARPTTAEAPATTTTAPQETTTAPPATTTTKAPTSVTNTSVPTSGGR